MEVTAEQIADAGHDRMAWASPVEDAIAGLVGVGVSIDGDGDRNNIATIGTQERCTLIVELPANINAWLDARWDERWADAGSEPLHFEVPLDDWLTDLIRIALEAKP